MFESVTNREMLAIALYILLATAAFVLVLVLFTVAFRRTYGRIESWQERRKLSLRIQKLELLTRDQIAGLLLLVARVFRVLLTIFVLDFYVSFVLSHFPGTDPLPRPLLSYVLAPIPGIWSAFVEYLPNLIYILVFVVIARYTLKVIHFVFGAIETGVIVIRGFHPTWAETTYKIIRALVMVLVLIQVFPLLPGADNEFFSGVSLFIGALITLGSSSAIGNLMAGLVLTYTNAFRIGDWVEIGDSRGRVIEKNLLVTRIQTAKNEGITIPNGAVLAGAVKNFSELAASEGLILHTNVSIGYEVDWRRVHELLLSAAVKTSRVLDEPPPFVRQESLDDFSVIYELNAYTDEPSLMSATYSELHQNVLEAFNQAEVEILSPHYCAVRNGDPTTIPRRSPTDTSEDGQA